MEKLYKNKEEVYDIFGKMDGDRFLEIFNTEITREEKNEILKKIVGNNLIKSRRKLRKLVRKLDDSVQMRNDAYKDLKKIAAHSLIWEYDSVRKIVESLSKLDNSIYCFRKELAIEGVLIRNSIELYNVLATDHEFAQIINANIKQIQKYRKQYDMIKHNISDSFFIVLITSYCIEPKYDCVFARALVQSKQKYKNNNIEPVIYL
ncbi:hypothetical protein [Clostridium sp.]|uniref:hypothetical protein n=1 Tax=Clostridium sp. TaxID=1506 RepID=UPI002852BCA0|nr:hypothetical protein [Clostridium sp.]